MERIVLFTRTGQPVVDIEIPSFRPKAEVVMWGLRTFVWHPDAQQYREALMYVVPANAHVSEPTK